MPTVNIAHYGYPTIFSEKFIYPRKFGLRIGNIFLGFALALPSRAELMLKQCVLNRHDIKYRTRDRDLDGNPHPQDCELKQHSCCKIHPSNSLCISNDERKD